MRVLNIVKYYHPSKGGMETFVRRLSEGIRTRGVETTILTASHRNFAANTFEEIGGVQLYRVGCLAKIMSQPLTYSFGSKLKELIENSDLIHINCPFPNAEIYSGFLKKKPLVVTWHADPAGTRWKCFLPLYKPVLNRVLNYASSIAVTSPNLLKLSPTLQPFINKCTIIPLSFRFGSDNFVQRTIVDKKGGTPIILFVGLLRPYKGLKYLIKAITQVHGANLKIIGRGEEEKDLKLLVRKLGLQSRVIFLNNVSDEEMSAHYRSAYMFVLPSVSPAEAFGIVQLEAMSFGLPVINTDLPSGVPYVSLHGITGLTVPPKDDLSLAQAINNLLENKKLYNTLSRNAIERSKEFTEEKMINSYLKLYNDVL